MSSTESLGFKAFEGFRVWEVSGLGVWSLPLTNSNTLIDIFIAIYIPAGPTKENRKDVPRACNQNAHDSWAFK